MFPSSLEHAADDVEVVEDGQEDQQLVEDAVHLALKTLTHNVHFTLKKIENKMLKFQFCA